MHLSKYQFVRITADRVIYSVVQWLCKASPWERVTNKLDDKKLIFQSSCIVQSSPTKAQQQTRMKLGIIKCGCNFISFLDSPLSFRTVSANHMLQ